MNKISIEVVVPAVRVPAARAALGTRRVRRGGRRDGQRRRAVAARPGRLAQRVAARRARRALRVARQGLGRVRVRLLAVRGAAVGAARVAGRDRFYGGPVGGE